MEAVQQLMNEMSEQKDYIFNTDKITYSSVNLKGVKKSYVTGYISVPEVDLYNDLITPAALKSMLKQITETTITLDYEHEAWRDDNTILPVGRITEAKIDAKGLWVKAELNTHSPKYKALWGSVKDGFLNAFSIAFKPIKVVTKTIGDTAVRLIEELKLLNVALTATPVNAGAIMTGHNMKSVMLKAIEDTNEEKVLVSKKLITKLMEVKSMGEETETTKEAVETPVETAEVVETPTAETPEATPEAEAEKPAEVKEVVEAPVEEPELKAIVEDLKAKVEAQAKELKIMKDQPVFKSIQSESKPEMKSEKVSMLGLIR